MDPIRRSLKATQGIDAELWGIIDYSDIEKIIEYLKSLNEK